MSGKKRRGMGCFLIGLTGEGLTANGEALLGSVSDDPYDVRTFVRVVNPADGQAHVGTELISTTEHTLLERGYFSHAGETTRGVNEEGLAFTCAMVFEAETTEKDPKLQQFCDLTHDLMRNCRTVSEALALFEEAGGSALPMSILLADAAGDLAHVEVGTYGVNVNHHFTRTNPGMVFAVNCYLSQRLQPHNDPKAIMADERNNNLVRRQRGQQLATDARGKLDVAALGRILSDHANEERNPQDNPLLPGWGYSICNHGTRHSDTYPVDDLPWGTVSAEILQPATRTLWYAYGWPCGRPAEHGDQLFQDRSWGEFRPFSLNAVHCEVNETQDLTTPVGELIAAGNREGSVKLTENQQNAALFLSQELR